MKKNILVIGSNGQLGQMLHSVSSPHNVHFVSREELDITNYDQAKDFLDKDWDFCVNATAYTAVDRAEEEREQALLVNGEAVGHLAMLCAARSIRLIHISTDYVFSGSIDTPYRETDPTSPINMYGTSKLLGENLALKYNPTSFIIRTSWLYSECGHNFVKTMLTLAQSKDEINVVANQYGSPTYAGDLASAIFSIIDKDDDLYGIYHYSNGGKTSWAGFAEAIFELKGLSTKVVHVPDSSYPTKARRPHFSILDTTKIQQNFGLSIPHWKDSLRAALQCI